ncbi:MAG: hypothetical protein U9O87_06895 [Verrucomicrobiota bacterium]|nr:hypothetical protein [Verrucomicrobiota bacterium]
MRKAEPWPMDNGFEMRMFRGCPNCGDVGYAVKKGIDHFLWPAEFRGIKDIYNCL